MISYKMARRSFLRNCGGSAALMVPLLRGIEAHAQGIKAPLRFLVIHHPLGSVLDQVGVVGGDLWRPAGVTATTMFGPTVTLPQDSAPFAPLQSKMVMIDGLNVVTSSRMAGSDGGFQTHEGGMVGLMTGVPTLGRIGTQDHSAGGPSFDQLLLAQSPQLGGAGAPITARTPFGSLQLAADIRSDRDEIAPRVLSYLPPTTNPDISLARQPLFSETQPLNTFNRIFGGSLPTGSNAGVILAQKLSVLDFMRSDLARLGTLVPATEKPKLDTHAAAIQQLEASLRAQLVTTTTGSVCLRPAAPPSFSMTGLGAHGNAGNEIVGGGSKLTGVDYYDPADPNNHPHVTLGRLQLSLIKAAFACDLVRVATFMWSAGTNWVVFPGTVGGKTNPSNSPQPHHPPSHVFDSATIGWISQIDTLYAQQTSLALQEFVNQTDIDGANLLDNTIVPYVTEVARAYDHNFYNVPYLVFGGKNTGIQGGKFLKVTDGTLKSRDVVLVAGMLAQPQPSINRPTNDVWLALAPKFGVTLTALGNKGTQYIGPLPGLVV